MSYGTRRQHGYSFVDVLITMAIISILAASAGWSYRTMKASTEGTAAITATVEAFRRANLLARGVQHDLPWGVRVTATSITTFAGSTYTGRTTAYDEVYRVPSSVTIAATNLDTIFASLTGMPSAQTQITITNGLGRIRTITLNTYGTISY